MSGIGYTIYPLASVHGRFQPFHRGHLTYVLLAKQRCQHLIIGITNPDSRHLIPNPADPKRHLPESNPFTYFERARMIFNSVVDSGVSPTDFTIVPYPIDSPKLLSAYCPRGPVMLRDRGLWTQAKIVMLQENGWCPELIEDNTNLDVTATEVRLAIASSETWRDMVPQGVAKVLDEIGARERIRRIKRCPVEEGA
jgi:nicotinamide-nucleotide adenylyltransferase